MNVLARRLLPLFETITVVIERNAVGIKTFTVRSVYHNMLRRKVQHLPELHFTSAQFLLCSFALSDVDYSTGVLNQIATRTENRMTNAVNVPDGATREHNAIIHFFVQLVMPGPLGRFQEGRLIVG